MKDFEYARPETLREALDLLGQAGTASRPFLGGTDLLVKMIKGRTTCDRLVDLKRVGDIGKRIEIGDGRARIGSRVILSDLVEDEQMKSLFPALVDAASSVGSAQIRNRATLAGNICNASPAADTVAPLVVYGAGVEIAGRGGRRIVALRDFLLGPGRTTCASDEIVTAIEMPVPNDPCGAAFARLTRRRGVDLAIVNASCAIDSGGMTTFAFGAAGPTVVVAVDESGRLADVTASLERKEDILRRLVATTRPIGDIRASREYRDAMLLVLGRRVLAAALGRYRGGSGGSDV